MQENIHRITADDVFADDSDFPLSIKRLKEHAATDIPHAHEFHELVVLQGGTGTHATAHGNYKIEAGDVFLVRGDMAHSYPDTNHVELTNILFQPGPLGMPLHHLRDLPGYHVLFRIEPKLRESSHFRHRLRLNPEQLSKALQYVDAIELELATRSPGYRFTACADLMSLLGYLARCYDQSNRSEGRSLMRLGEVLTFMQNHLDEEISIDTLSKISSMSESTLTRRFRTVLGRTPIEHLTKLRIDKARRLMHRKDLNISEISQACGFSDSNYFSRRFKKSVGQSPRAYRRTL